MKDFARARGRLRTLSFHARLAYSVFLVFSFVGVLLTAWLLDDMVGLRFDRVDEYYAGEQAAAVRRDPGAEPSVSGVGGPVIDLPEEAAEVGVVGAVSQRKLLEVTHFHLFTMPVYLLILSHLFMLSRAGSRFKTSIIALATVGTAAHVAAPWAATSGSAQSVAFYAISGTAMGIGYMAMSTLPLWEMWWPERAPRRSSVEGALSSSAAGKAGSPTG